MKALITLGAALLVSACAAKLPPPEPVVQTQIVKEAVPVPCAALSQLGPEPAYADDDNTLAVTKGIDNRVVLLLTGRKQRNDRLAEYGNARSSCQRLH